MFPSPGAFAPPSKQESVSDSSNNAAISIRAKAPPTSSSRRVALPTQLLHFRAPTMPANSSEIRLNDGYQPQRFDVICNRDRDSVFHAGNNRFRVCVEMRLTRYRGAKTRADKTLIVKEIIDAVRASGGRFIRQQDAWNASEGAQIACLVPVYYDIGNKKAAEKVGKALRAATRKQNTSSRRQSWHPEPSRDEDMSDSTKTSASQLLGRQESFSHRRSSWQEGSTRNELEGREAVNSQEDGSSLDDILSSMTWELHDGEGNEEEDGSSINETHEIEAHQKLAVKPIGKSYQTAIQRVTSSNDERTGAITASNLEEAGIQRIDSLLRSSLTVSEGDLKPLSWERYIARK